MIMEILKTLKPMVEPAAGKILENVAKNYVLDKCIDPDIRSTAIYESSDIVTNVLSHGIQTLVNTNINSNTEGIIYNNEYNDLYKLACAQKFDRTF